jgi:hypothetical protein
VKSRSVQYAEGAAAAAAAYKEIHQQVSAHPRAAARLRAVILAVHRAAPSPAGEPANRTAQDIARQVGRFQASALALDDPEPPPAPAPKAEDLAITRTFDTLDMGDNQAVQLVKEYLGGLVEDGPVVGGRTRRRRPAHLLRPVQHRCSRRRDFADTRDRSGEPAPVSAAGHRARHRLRQLHYRRSSTGGGGGGRR